MNQITSISTEIQARILSGNQCYYAYGKLMQSRALNTSSKFKMYKSLTTPVVIYECELGHEQVEMNNILEYLSAEY